RLEIGGRRRVQVLNREPPALPRTRYESRVRASTPARGWLCHYAEVRSLVEPGTGGLTPLTSKGPSDASAAVFRIRESRGADLRRCSFAARGSGGDPDHRAGCECEPARLEDPQWGYVWWPAVGGSGLPRI